MRVCVCVHVCLNAEETRLNELQFADDAALLTTSLSGAEKALQEYNLVASKFGLTVSMPKTKLTVTGREATEVDMAPINLGAEEVHGECQPVPLSGANDPVIWQS